MGRDRVARYPAAPRSHVTSKLHFVTSTTRMPSYLCLYVYRLRLVTLLHEHEVSSEALYSCKALAHLRASKAPTVGVGSSSACAL